MESGSKKISSRLGALIIVLGATLWGTTGTFQAFAPEGTSPLALGEVRITLAGLFLLVWVIYKEGIRSLRGPWATGSVLLSASGMAGFQLCFFAAVLKTGVAVGTMVTIGSSPIIAGLLGRVILGEKLTNKWKIATLMAVIGCCLIARGDGQTQFNLLGITLALMAGFSYGVMGLGMKNLQKSHSPLAIITAIMLTGALLASPVYAFVPLGWITTIRGITVSMGISLLSTTLAYALFSLGLTVVPISTAYTLTLAEPLTACLLGIFLLGEQLPPSGIAGIVLLFSGVVFMATEGEKTDQGQKSPTYRNKI